MSQQSGEMAEQYVMALYDLAENCNYGDLKEEMISDRLVVGIKDNALSEKLQLDSRLTLESAKTAIRLKEAVHEQQQTLKGIENATSPVGTVDSIRNKQPNARGNPRRRKTETAPSWREV